MAIASLLLFVGVGVTGMVCARCLSFVLPYAGGIHWVSDHVTIGMDSVFAAVALWAITQLWSERERARVYRLLIVIAAVLLIGIDVLVSLLPRSQTNIGPMLTVLNYILPLVMCWAFYRIWRERESDK
jgi:hypothetical protein